MRIARNLCLGFLMLLGSVSLGSAQVPRYHKADGTPRKLLNLVQAQSYVALASFTRVKTIDANGNGDYSSFDAAFVDLATWPTCPSSPPLPANCRGGFSRVLVLVEPGDGSFGNAIDGYNFQSVSLAVPDFVTVQGVTSSPAAAISYSGQPVLRLTGTAGCLFQLGNQSGINSLTLKITTTTLTGDTQLVCVKPSPGGSAGAVTAKDLNLLAINVTEGSFALSLLRVDNTTDLSHSMSLTGTGIGSSRSGSGVGPNARNVEVVGQASAVLFGGWHRPLGAGQAIYFNPSGPVASGQALRLFAPRIDASGSVVQLYNAGSVGTFSQVGTPYTSSFGTIVDESVNAALVAFTGGAKVLSGAGAPEGAVTAPVGSLWLRNDGSTSTSLCVKETGSGNTGWICK